MREKLLDPTGISDRAVDTTLAPRLRNLRGLTAGLLENSKPNAAGVLRRSELDRRAARAWAGPPPVVRVGGPPG
jgi:hypothetical protein